MMMMILIFHNNAPFVNTESGKTVISKGICGTVKYVALGLGDDIFIC